MERQELIKKTMVKLGMIGQPKDPIRDRDKDDLLKILWNEKDPKKVIKFVQDFMVQEHPSKEAKQDLFKFFKLKGLFKRSLKLHKDNEKAWRLLLKESGLRGFLLEN